MKLLQDLRCLPLTILLLTCLISCSKDELQNGDDLSVVSVKLKSITNEHTNVFLDIESVDLRVKEFESMENAWVNLKTVNAGTYNADDIQSDNPLSLVEDFDLKAGSVYEIRLNLGDNNFINLNNNLHHLEAQTSGEASASNILDILLSKNKWYTFFINLDIDESIRFDEDQNMMVLAPKIYTEIRQVQF